jgi:hypothetical protein
MMIYLISHCTYVQRRCIVLISPASYSEDTGFKSRPADRLSWMRVFVDFLSPSATLLKIRPQPLPSTFFPNHHLLTTYSFDAVSSELVKVTSLYKPHASHRPIYYCIFFSLTFLVMWYKLTLKSFIYDENNTFWTSYSARKITTHIGLTFVIS